MIREGVNLLFLHQRTANIESQYMLPAFSLYENENDFALKLQMHAEQADIIHVHNMPDWMVWRAKDICPDKPVVYDVHDIPSIMAPADVLTRDELKAFVSADAYVFPSMSYELFALKTYGQAQKPSTVLYSMCTKGMFPEVDEFPRSNGIVYEGLISVPETRPAGVARLEYGDFRGFVENLCMKHKIPFHIYAGSNSWWPYYQHTGVCIHPSTPYFDLLRELTRYEWAYVGPAKPCEQWNMAMPNKFFESIAAGVPILTCGAAEVAEWVAKYKIGVVLDSPEDIPKVYADKDLQRKCRESVLRHRFQFCMEAQIRQLIDLYHKVLRRDGYSEVRPSSQD